MEGRGKMSDTSSGAKIEKEKKKKSSLSRTTSVYLAKLSKEPFHNFVLESWSINYSAEGRLRLYVLPSILKETSLFV